ncbi:MAG: hypothetical protein ACRCWY_06340 [Cellulosilyticaceae bacterium]
MAVQGTKDEVKVVLKLAKGSQTISKCNKEATDEAYYALGQAIGTLQQEVVQHVTKVEETILAMA